MKFQKIICLSEKLQSIEFIQNNNLQIMSRTLGPILSHDSESQQIEQNNEPFYLNEQLPMFLAHTQGEIKNYSNLDEDIAKCKLLIESLCDNQLKTKESLQEISQLLEKQKTLNKGMGYFAAKNMIFLEYLMLIKLYELFKINGKSLTSGNGLQLYKRLAYLKTLMLKLQPVQKKLEYQKNKILKHSDRAIVTKQKKKQDSEQQESIAQEGDDEQKVKKQEEEQIEEEEQEEDQMAFKPRPSALMKIKQQKDIKLTRNDKYEAPKISSNLSKEDKLKQRMQRQKEVRKLGLIRRLQSDLIDDDRADQKYVGDEINERFKRKFQQKISYEEDTFVRVPDSKKDKFYMKQMIKNNARKNQLDEDFKQVQLVRHLFEQENQVQSKIVNDKKKHQGFKKGNKSNSQQQNGNPKKFKKITKR